jgi:hypothetical protein
MGLFSTSPPVSPSPSKERGKNIKRGEIYAGIYAGLL